jgi:acetylornithine deacetylase
VIQTVLEQLVAIDSVNPDLVPGGAGEGAIGWFVAEWLRAAGCEVAVEPVDGERANVIAVVPGSGGGRTLMLNSHLDTVGVTDMPDAHTPIVRDGRLFGRGAGDTKAGLAAAMFALRELAAAQKLGGDVTLTAVVDEEAASKGTEAVAGRRHADGCIVLEPTGLAVEVAHKGFVWLTVRTEGVAAHGSRSDLGVDAIAKLGQIIVAVQALDERLRSRPGHRLVGTGSVHCSLVEGGSGLSTYPPLAELRVERRTIPGESDASVRREFEAIIDEARARDPSLRASLELDFIRSPLLGDAGEAIVEVLCRHAPAELGRPVEMIGGSGWTDAALLSAAGVPSVVFGPSADGIHGLDESVELASVDACRRVLVNVAKEFCR